MNDRPELGHQDLEDCLAEFTDQVLSDGAAVEEMLASQDVDLELHELQQTVALLQEAVARAHPDKHIADRIRAKMIIQWKKQGLDRRAKPKQNRMQALFQSLKQHLRPPVRRKAVYGFVTTFVILILAVLFLSPEFAGGLVGAAGTGELPDWLPISLALILIGLAIGWWINRSKRR